jgi:hypothetical protein
MHRAIRHASSFLNSWVAFVAILHRKEIIFSRVFGMANIQAAMSITPGHPFKLSTVEIVQAGRKIIIIDPDDWDPFAWYDELTKLYEQTLRFSTHGNIYNEDELLLRYTFQENGSVKNINLGRVTLWSLQRGRYP